MSAPAGGNPTRSSWWPRSRTNSQPLVECHQLSICHLLLGTKNMHIYLMQNIYKKEPGIEELVFFFSEWSAQLWVIWDACNLLHAAPRNPGFCPTSSTYPEQITTKFRNLCPANAEIGFHCCPQRKYRFLHLSREKLHQEQQAGLSEKLQFRLFWNVFLYISNPNWKPNASKQGK